MKNKEFLKWLSNRLVHVYGESENVDFVRRLNRIVEEFEESEKDEDSYYLSKGFVGNDFLFWRKGNAGYTTNINDAQIFTKDEAYRQHAQRVEDQPILKSIADGISHRAVSIELYNLELSKIEKGKT